MATRSGDWMEGRQAWTETVSAEADDAVHLRPFTQTAPVPVVGRAPRAAPDLRFHHHRVVQNVGRWRRPKTPLALRLAVWVVALALAAGVAGLVVHHLRPGWLRSLEVTAGSARPAATAGAAHGSPVAATPRSSTSAPQHLGPPAVVSQTQTGLDSATMSVQAASYDVVVTAQEPCWVEVISPASYAPLFSATMPAGATQTFPAANGQLTVRLGASGVVVDVQVGGKTVPGWQFTPSAAPFTLNFASGSG